MVKIDFLFNIDRRPILEALEIKAINIFYGFKKDPFLYIPKFSQSKKFELTVKVLCKR